MILKAPQLNWSLAYNYKGRFANLAGGMWRGEFCIREAWHCLREAGVLFQTFVHGGGHSLSLLALSPICGAGRAKDFNRPSRSNSAQLCTFESFSRTLAMGPQARVRPRVNLESGVRRSDVSSSPRIAAFPKQSASWGKGKSRMTFGQAAAFLLFFSQCTWLRPQRQFSDNFTF